MQNILLIDDEPQVIQDMLTLYGYQVESANDGYSGIQHFFQNKNRYDLVILNIQVTRMNGWSVLKTIRSSEENPNIPLLALTPTDCEEHLIASLRRGADACIAKPVHPSRLLAHVESILRRYEWGEHLSRKQIEVSLESLSLGISLLTPRENEILKLMVQGGSNQEISKKLVISQTTVKNHLAHIFKKMKVSNRTQAAYMAQKLYRLSPAKR